MADAESSRDDAQAAWPSPYETCANVPKIILFGDSITQQSFAPETQGWGMYLANYYIRRADVYNRGFSGYTTRWAVTALPYVFSGELCKNVRLVTVFLGANDSCAKAWNARHHVPLHTYQQNLETIVLYIREHVGVGTRIVLITPPPFHLESYLPFQKEKWKDQATGISERRNLVTKMYADVVVALGKKLGVPVLNLYARMMSSCPDGSWYQYLSDGLHFSLRGNRFVGERLVELLQKEFPQDIGGDLDATMQHSLPWHTDL
jgi:isoamyl acetate esterase|eukprot:Stramenopile-MAST_4_protein_3950